MKKVRNILWGKAIVRHAESEGVPLLAPEEFKASGGLGVQARINGSMVMVGKPDWFRELKIPIVRPLNVSGSCNPEGKTVMVVARENRLCGLIAVSDELKPDSAEAIRELQDQHLKVVMLTGDNLQTAKPWETRCISMKSLRK